MVRLMAVMGTSLGPPSKGFSEASPILSIVWNTQATTVLADSGYLPGNFRCGTDKFCRVAGAAIQRLGETIGAVDIDTEKGC